MLTVCRFVPFVLIVAADEARILDHDVVVGNPVQTDMFGGSGGDFAEASASGVDRVLDPAELKVVGKLGTRTIIFIIKRTSNFHQSSGV